MTEYPNYFSQKVLLSLGSNIGDSRLIILKAIDSLDKIEGISVLKISSFYETEPFGFVEQANFINVSVLLETLLLPFELLKICKQIEFSLGRKQRPRWYEREIDIDIVLFADLSINSDILVLPHPQMHLRRFVLQPSAEIAPEMQHPVLKRSVASLFANCSDVLKVEITNIEDISEHILTD